MNQKLYHYIDLKLINPVVMQQATASDLLKKTINLFN
jgi:hypothetical protein